MSYTYKLAAVQQQENITYTSEDLEKLTTLQLREICRREKIVVGTMYKLDRPYMIKTILDYRGTALTSYITQYNDNTFTDVLEHFNAYLKLNKSSEHISIPVKLCIYKGLDITIHDDYKVYPASLIEASVFLLDDQKEICALLKLVQLNGQNYLMFDKDFIKKDLAFGTYRNYSLGFLDKTGTQYLYDYYYNTKKLLPMKLNCTVKPINELQLLDVVAVDTPLMIDFGTSNTALGAYVPYKGTDITRNQVTNEDHIHKVKFVDYFNNDAQCYEILPTKVSIKDCSSTPIQYNFGFEVTTKHYCSNNSTVFFNIKRWVNDYDKYEQVYDENGNTAQVQRTDILKAYFNYIITQAEQQHKRRYKLLHITSPIKQKQQYLDLYKELLPNYEVITEKALDEGIAVLYNSISNQIKKNNFESGTQYKALIIDCGGGTTDLTSCNYTLVDNKLTYKLKLEATYSNGDANFGGNNLTYRIFQYLKIVLTYFYQNTAPLDIEQLMGIDTSDLYRFVDEQGVHAAYDNLERLYQDCEEVIPTAYNAKVGYVDTDYVKVKNNFYFLWALAERVKILFFQSIGQLSVRLNHEQLYGDKYKAKVIAEQSWCLNVYADEKHSTVASKQLLTTHEFPDLLVTKEEITTLIKPDIYNVIKKFLEPLYLNQQLGNFHFIKLTGQTCKIDIFRDSLKEYIAGKVIETTRKQNTINDFKLTCLEGAIKYQNAQLIGEISPEIIVNPPVKIYKLIAYTHTNDEKVLISRTEEKRESYGYISRNIDTQLVELFLLDAEDKVLYKYMMDTNSHYFTETNYKEASEKYRGQIDQQDIDNIVEGELKVFTYNYDDRWGFCFTVLARDDGRLLESKTKYVPFETEEWELNFFDGMK